MISIIIVIVSLLLDGIISNFVPYQIGNLSLFTPALTLISIIIVKPFYYHKDKKYLILAFIIGIIYDLLYTNLLFFNGLLFLFMAYINVKLYKYISIDYLKLIIYISLLITTYEITSSIIFIIYNLVPINISKIIYKISHTLILNILYGELLYLIINLIPKKYKKININ